jgi:hypothetical protein
VCGISPIPEAVRFRRRSQSEAFAVGSVFLADHPLLCPQVTKLVTGQEADSHEFQRDWSAFLERIAEALLKSRSVIKRKR